MISACSYVHSHSLARSLSEPREHKILPQTIRDSNGQELLRHSIYIYILGVQKSSEL